MQGSGGEGDVRAAAGQRRQALLQFAAAHWHRRLQHLAHLASARAGWHGERAARPQRSRPCVRPPWPESAPHMLAKTLRTPEGRERRVSSLGGHALGCGKSWAAWLRATHPFATQIRRMQVTCKPTHVDAMHKHKIKSSGNGGHGKR